MADPGEESVAEAGAEADKVNADQPSPSTVEAATDAIYSFKPTPLSSVATASVLSSVPILAQAFAPPPSTSLFFTSVHWSPDATCLLTSAEDNVLRLYNTHDLTSASPSSAPALLIPLPAAVYATGWYPRMQSAVAESALLVAAVRDQPLQLLSGWTGEQRASYISLSDKEEVVSALSVCFAESGDTLYAGYDGYIRAFDTATPGLPYMTVPTASKGNNKRRRTDGQYGLISSLSTAADASLLAAGSYSGQAALYDTRNLHSTLLLPCNTTGVSQVVLRPPLLFVGGRGRDSDIVVFDVRQTRYEVGRLQRSSNTQQRVAFDVSRGDGGRWLATGEGGGRGVGVFDLTLPSDEESGYVDGMWTPCGGSAGGEGGVGGAGGVVNGVSFHPLFGGEFPYLATVTGDRQFVRYDDDSDTESESSSEDEESGKTTVKRHYPPSTLSLWHLQPHRTPAHDDGPLAAT